MSFLEGLANFSTGATQGLNQGLDLYSKYAQIQDANKQRQTQTQLDDYLKQSVAKGDFNDHAAGLRKYGDFALGLGKADIFSAASQQAAALEEAQQHKLGLQAFQVINTGDVKSALPLLNQYADKAGLGLKYDIRDTPDGKIQLISTGQGGTTVKNYDDLDHLRHDALQVIKPGLFKDTGDYFKGQTEEAVAAANIQQSQASATSALAQAEKARLEGPANVAQSYASAAASGAAAKKYGLEASQVVADAQSQRQLRGAQAEAYGAQTESQLADTVSRQLEGAKDIIGPKPANMDTSIVTPIASDLMKNNNMGMNEAIAASSAVTDPDTKPIIDAVTGSVKLGDQAYRLSPSGLAQLARALRQNIDRANAANE